jgi:pyruvate dehydrogenase E2 component (dihydrolipoamide acetyltransferase)
MPTNVVMPQMGESIAEGTIVRWVKQVGEKVDRDEPLFEISTDKVDAEIPSPVAGVITEIRANAGDTVPVNTVVAVIDPSPSAERPAVVTSATAREAPLPGPAVPAAATVPPAPQPAAAPAPTTTAPAPPVEPAATQAVPPARVAASLAERPADAESVGDLRRQRSSPLVRKIAREHNVDIGAIAGTGVGGRVTKQDILDYLGGGGEARPSAQAPPAPVRPPGPVSQPIERVEVVPMSVMRRRIAEHMITSRRTSAHVHSVFEVDFTKVSAIRAARKAEYERAGVKLTFMPFIMKAIVDALGAVPVVNASIDGDNIVYRRDINLGVAVALDWGLIVPVVRNADEKNILGLSRAINDLAERARQKRLKPEEVQGGTFTITNPGVFGALFGMPIINQPQVAILGVGAIEKRPVVVDDAIAIRPRAYITLGYDHRLIDGAVADQFMSVVKKQLENFDGAGV